MKKNYATLVMAGLFLMNLPAQAQEANYDESNVGTYTLPDVLTSLNGQQVIKKKTWEKISVTFRLGFLKIQMKSTNGKINN